MIMRLTRSELKQIAGEVWTNGGSYVLDGSEILKKLQTGIKNVGPKLQDSTEIEFTDDETKVVNQVKNKIGLK